MVSSWALGDFGYSWSDGDCWLFPAHREEGVLSVEGRCCLVLVLLDGVWAQEADTGLRKLFLSLHSPHNLRGTYKVFPHQILQGTSAA